MISLRLCLRFSRRLWRSLLTGGLGSMSLGPAALPCVVLLGFLAVSGPSLANAAATTRSRVRRITPALTPLRYTERSVPAPRHGKTTTKAAANHAAPTAGARPRAKGASSDAHAAAHSRTETKTEIAANHGGKHARDTDYGAPIPLPRTGRGKGIGDELARSVTKAGRHGSGGHAQIAEGKLPSRRIPLPAPDPAGTHHQKSRYRSTHEGNIEQETQGTVVAEVMGRSAEGDILARLHTHRPGVHVPGAGSGANPVIVASAVHPAPHVSSTPSTQAPVERRLPASEAYPAAAFASDAAGSDIPRPYPPASPTHSTPSLPTVTVQAPANRGSDPDTSPSAVVGGFGSELALAPALPSRNPGLTRRRSHSLPPSALPALSEDTRSSAPAVLAANLPSTLAERDAVTAGAIAPSILSPNLPNLYDSDGRLVMPAPLRGSREVLIHQNTMADNDGLERIQNDTELNRLRSTRQLIDLPASVSLRINEDLPYNRRSARPWTALFTQDIARDYYARFHQPLWITSAVRTVAFQAHLLRVNGNAAGLSGDFASPHLTGQAIDFGKHGMTAAQLAWMRSYLLPLIQSGKIDVEEEFQQACFHISVYRRYAGGRRLVTATIQASTQPANYPPIRPMATVPASLPASGPVVPPVPNVLTNPELTDTDR